MSEIVTLAADEYHSGIDETPRLSASIAHILCTRSPRHAWTAHPWLNPDYARVEDTKFDVGNVAHGILLEESTKRLVVVDAPDWKTKAAREERDAAREAGKIPLLLEQLSEVEAMVAAARVQLDGHEAEPPLFSDGKPEQSLLWEEGGVLCKARLDWLRDDRRTIDDLKTTSRSANPAAYSRALFGVGGDVQAAFYLRGLRELTGTDATFRWVVVETSPPYALSVIEPGSDVLAVGATKVDWAIAKWRECLENDSWPAYPPRVATAELPPWEEARWLEQRGAVAA